MPEEVNDWFIPDEQRNLPLAGGSNLPAGSSIFSQHSAVMRLFEGVTKELQNHISGEAGTMADDMVNTLTKKRENVSPEEISTFVAAVHSTGRYDLVPKVEDALRQYEASRGLQAGESSAAMAAQFKAIAASGVNPIRRKLYDGIAQNVVEGEAALQKDPLTEGGVRQWVKAPRPLALDDPQAMAANLRERQENLAVIRRMQPSVGEDKSALLPGEVSGVVNALTQAPVQQAAGMLQAIQSLAPETYKATMADLKDGLIGMSRSNDPARMTLGMSTLDNLWRQNAPEFKATFKEGTVERLLAWNGLKGSFTAPEIIERMNKADDPSTAKARKLIGGEVDEELKDKKPADIAWQLGSGLPILNTLTFNVTGSTPGIPTDALAARVLQAEHESVYRALRVYGVDKDAATKLATDRIKADWGPSELVHGTLMKHPPEMYYKPINGSFDWMKDDLNELITGIKGEPDPMQGPYGNLSRVKGLVSDGQTEAEIAAGKPASYKIALNTPNGSIEFLTDANGNQRFAFNRAPHQAAYEKGWASVDQMRKVMKEYQNGSGGVPDWMKLMGMRPQ